MKFTTDSKTLKQTLSQVLRASNPNSPLPVLACVHLRTEREGIVLTCTDDNIQLSGTLAAKVEKHGDTCVNAKKLLALLNSDGPLTFKGEGQATVKIGKSTYRLPTILSQEFPFLPEVESQGGPIQWGALRDGLKRTLPAAARDYSKLAAIDFLIGPSQLRLTATNRHILVRCESPLDTTAQQMGGLLPVEAAEEMARLPEGVATFSANETLCWLRVGTYEFTSRLLPGPFPHCDAILGAPLKGGFNTPREPLIAALKRLQSVSGDDLHRVGLTFGGEELMVVADAQDLGSGEEALTCRGDLPNAATCLHSDQLLSLLAVWEGEEVGFAFEGENRPVHLFPMEGGGCHGVLMPLVRE